VKLTTDSQYYKTFFRYRRISPDFAAKLGHFTISDFFYLLQNTEIKHRKSENEEKSFIGSATGVAAARLPSIHNDNFEDMFEI